MLKIQSKPLITALLLGGAIAGAQGQTISYPNAFTGLTFTRPVGLYEVPGKPNTFIVVEQNGGLQVVANNGTNWTETLFAKITVTGGTSAGDERGLLGFAFHPKYTENRKYYTYCVRGSSEVIEERTADATLLKDGGAAARTILSVPDPESNHNGGTLAFGPKDGYLYFGIGDGGGGGDQHNPPNGQNRKTFLGKFHRIDINSQAGGKPYAIPSDNPFATATDTYPEIWALGLRNPFKWAFDPVTGDLWAGDVGQDLIEEVSIIKKGLNYGWNKVEGNRCFVTGCNMNEFENPVFTYPRGNGGGNCVTGGVVYRGIQSSPYYGTFIFGDYGSNNVWSLKASGQATPLAKPTAIGISSFASDSKGQVYIMGVDSKTIFRMEGLNGVASAIEGNRLTQKADKVFFARPGDRLDMSLLTGTAPFVIYTPEGKQIGTLSMESAMVPAEMKAGIYLLKAKGGFKPHVLIIK